MLHELLDRRFLRLAAQVEMRDVATLITFLAFIILTPAEKTNRRKRVTKRSGVRGDNKFSKRLS